MDTFRELHRGGSPLLLPNAWDVGSAVAFVADGYPAIGTTSFGVAASAGYPDGGRASKAATAALVPLLCRLPVFVTADVEDGYSPDPGEAADFVAGLVEAGVAGINLEDSLDGHLVAPEDAAAKIAAVRRRCPGVFINARVDNLWFMEDPTVDAVLARARRYADAGADGIFVPGLANPAEIEAITGALELPVNVLPHPNLTVAELGGLGVRRVSSGSLPYRAAVDAAVASVAALRDGRTAPSATPYWDMQHRLESYAAALRPQVEGPAEGGAEGPE